LFVRLNSKEIDNQSLYNIPASQDDVGMPTDHVDCIADSELVHQQCNICEDGVRGHSLSASLVRQAFDRVHGLKGRPSKTKTKSDEEDDHD
jgi:hypothetical protein